MEKILDLKKSTTMGPSKMYRFQCDCLTAEDAMDITIDACGKEMENKYIVLSMNFLDKSFFKRLKYACQIIRGNWNWRDFVVRDHDLKDLSVIFDPNVKYSELE